MSSRILDTLEAAVKCRHIQGVDGLAVDGKLLSIAIQFCIQYCSIFAIEEIDRWGSAQNELRYKYVPSVYSNSHFHQLQN